MNILQVLPYFSPRHGGPVKSTLNLSKELSLRGHQVTVLTTDFELNKESQKSHNSSFNRIVFSHCAYNFGMYLITPSINDWLKENIKMFDIIHMQDYRSYQNNAVCNYAIRYNIPYLLQARGSVLPFFEKQWLKRFYDIAWGYKILRNARKVIALNTVEIDQYKKMGIPLNKIELIPNGLDLGEYNHLPEKGLFKFKYKIKPHEKVILYLGRIHKIKGIDLLIKAFSDLTKEFDDIKLVVAGADSGYLDDIKRLINDLSIGKNVIITGPIYGRDKLAAYVDADIYVLPSLYETFPNTILEACACGTPVILTDRCGIADIINDNAGLVIPWNRQKLKAAMSFLIINSEARTLFGKNAKKMIHNQFELSNIVCKIENVYMAMI